jgi:hypothetical protein
MDRLANYQPGTVEDETVIRRDLAALELNIV